MHQNPQKILSQLIPRPRLRGPEKIAPRLRQIVGNGAMMLELPEDKANLFFFTSGF